MSKNMENNIQGIYIKLNDRYDSTIQSFKRTLKKDHINYKCI